MNQIKLTHNIQPNTTILPNEFIDEYMIKADGEFVKIYLLLLRLFNQGAYKGPDQIADYLNLTEKDVLRAFHYWQKVGLLDMEPVEEKKAENPDRDRIYEINSQAKASNSIPATATSDILPELSSRQAPKKKPVTPKEIQSATEGTDLKQTIFMTETYIGHPLSHSELESFYYMENQLHFSPDLLEYLIEYCVTRGKKSIRYMEAVAISWYEQQIDTVKKAKEQSASYTQNVFPVMKAFGINGRNLAPAEIEYIQKWNALGFDSEIIVEACNRTMMATHQASFPYANKILQQWKKQGVKRLVDIQTLDESFRKQKPAVAVTTTASPAHQKTSSNAFHNFDERTYDYDDLEARLSGIKQSQ